MNKTIKEAVKRLNKFKPNMEKEIIKTYKDYKKGLKNVCAYKSKGMKVTKKGYKNYTFYTSKEEALKSYASRLYWVFMADRYSSIEYIKTNKIILKGLFKDNKEVLKILNYSWNKIKGLNIK